MDTLTGEQIKALADDLEPLNPKGLGRAVEVIAILFGILCFIVVSLRVYVRAGLSGASARLWGLEDLLAVLGTVSDSDIRQPFLSELRALDHA